MDTDDTQPDPTATRVWPRPHPILVSLVIAVLTYYWVAQISWMWILKRLWDAFIWIATLALWMGGRLP